LLEEISAFPFLEVATGLPPPGPPGPAPDFSLKPGLEMTSMSDDVVVNVSYKANREILFLITISGNKLKTIFLATSARN
jgi:hypothetical protein